MDAMGEKTRARDRMRDAKVPVVPGSPGPITDEADAERLAREIGYPVMLKAAAGGGGKGMRRVDKEADFQAAWRGARGEAKSAFANDSVYLEKYLDEPRHIEIQLFADQQGHTIYLGERECSVQRRHQKVIEETPSPILDPEMRRKMGEVAVRAAQAVNYVGAGTVEFLVDAKRNFYFLEMNTRLQVEHPVTEWCTGLDLVRWQIEVAQGQPLAWTQADVQPRGHAIEARIYAEDPARNYLPSPGKIQQLRVPAGPWVRDDRGVYPGSTVSVYYDPMLRSSPSGRRIATRPSSACAGHFPSTWCAASPPTLALPPHPSEPGLPGRKGGHRLSGPSAEGADGRAMSAPRAVCRLWPWPRAIFAQQPPPGTQPSGNDDGLHNIASRASQADSSEAPGAKSQRMEERRAPRGGGTMKYEVLINGHSHQIELERCRQGVPGHGGWRGLCH